MSFAGVAVAGIYEAGLYSQVPLDDIKITGRALDPSEFMTKRSSPPGVTVIIR